MASGKKSPNAHRTNKKFEWLMFRGLLGADMRFTPLGSYSSSQVATASVAKGTQAAPGNYFIELRNEDDKTLSRENVHVMRPHVCHGHDAGVLQVEGRIALVPQADKLVFYRDDLLIETLAIESAPQIEIVWRHKRVSRKRGYTLELKLTPPHRHAFVVVSYLWDEGRYRTLGIFEPARELRFDFANLPGGKNCQLLVTYCSGPRSCTAQSEPFEVPPLEPRVHIVTPAANRRFSPWEPITASGSVIDEQSGSATDNQRLRWLLDGEPAGSGPDLFLQNVPAGEHELTLQYEDSGGALDSRRFRVLRHRASSKVAAPWWWRDQSTL